LRVDLVSKRYANAFYEVLKEKNKVSEVLQELRAFINTAKENADFIIFLKSPMIKKNEKILFFEKLRKEIKFSEELHNFFILLVNKGRIDLLPSISEYLNYLFMEDNNEVVADVTVACEIDESTKNELIKVLEKVTSKKVALNINVDAKIIAGLVAKVKSHQYDASVKGQLKRLKEILVG
jgi:F-type H+-transporting ATPase subunit delta